MARGSSKNSIGKGRAQVAQGTPPPSIRKPELRILPPDNKSPRRRAVVFLGASDHADVTSGLTGPLAHALWQLRGGTDISNWVDAERLLEDLLARVGAGPVGLDVVIPKRRTRVSQ